MLRHALRASTSALSIAAKMWRQIAVLLAVYAVSALLTRVGRLPVLTSHNALELADWHAYVRRVYGQPVPPNAKIDLNTFEWFYHDSPLGRRWWCSYWPLFASQCWVGVIPNMPETKLSEYGFFVKRRPRAMQGMQTLEVLRAIRPIDGAFTSAEVKVTWWFIVGGTGVFVHLETAPAVIPDRPLWWESDDERAVARYLNDESVVFADSRRGWWGVPVRHPRTVLVTPTPRERKPTCCPASLRLRAGWSGGQPCHSNISKAVVNCNVR